MHLEESCFPNVIGLNGLQNTSYLMPISDKSAAYKQAGGSNQHSSNHMNAFEFSSSYCASHNKDNSINMPLAFASNNPMTSLLFASHLYQHVAPSETSRHPI